VSASVDADASDGAGEFALPRDGVFAIGGGIGGVDDVGGGGIGCEDKAAVRSASLVSASILAPCSYRTASFRRTGIDIYFMRLLANISLIEGGGVLIDPVGHRSFR
jgi:hypothetical protein